MSKTRRGTRARGTGFSGLDSTKPTQAQEGDLANLGGVSPGGAVAMMSGPPQWEAPASDLAAAVSLAQGHPKSKRVPLLQDRSNAIGGFGSTKAGEVI